MKLVNSYIALKSDKLWSAVDDVLAKFSSLLSNEKLEELKNAKESYENKTLQVEALYQQFNQNGGIYACHLGTTKMNNIKISSINITISNLSLLAKNRPVVVANEITASDIYNSRAFAKAFVAFAEKNNIPKDNIQKFIIINKASLPNYAKNVELPKIYSADVIMSSYREESKKRAAEARKNKALVTDAGRVFKNSNNEMFTYEEVRAHSSGKVYFQLLARNSTDTQYTAYSFNKPTTEEEEKAFSVSDIIANNSYYSLTTLCREDALKAIGASPIDVNSIYYISKGNYKKLKLWRDSSFVLVTDAIKECVNKYVDSVKAKNYVVYKATGSVNFSNSQLKRLLETSYISYANTKFYKDLINACNIFIKNDDTISCLKEIRSNLKYYDNFYTENFYSQESVSYYNKDVYPMLYYMTLDETNIKDALDYVRLVESAK